MKKKGFAYALALFPLFGLLGFHQLYLENFKLFFIRLLAFCTIVGGIGFWVYDLVMLSKMVDKTNIKIEKELRIVMGLFEKSDLRRVLTLFSKSRNTKFIVREIIKRGKGEVMVRHFATTQEGMKGFEHEIYNGDSKGYVMFLLTNYLENKLVSIEV
jgi:TM2 domain-containing membrane protein YozV